MSLDPKHIKRTLQHKEYIAPEKNEAFLAFNEIDNNAYNPKCDIDKFASSYNGVVEKLNKVKGKSDIFSLGRTISEIAEKIKKSLKASGNEEEDKKLESFIDKLTENDLDKRPTAQEALNDPYLAK